VVHAAACACAFALAPVAGAAAVAVASPSSAVASEPSAGSAFEGSIARISPALARRMTGVSWRRGCPVPLSDLRVLTATYRGFDGGDHTGTLIVHRDVARRVLDVLRELYLDGFPIRRMTPVDPYGGDDTRSVAADNTSAFNCRYVEGTTRYSEHAYGRAIDVNPIENPYVTGAGTTAHRASIPYLRRTPFRPGMAAEGHALVRAFDAIGWGWGGRWSGAKDYQHFSASGQ
jgi:D-alanyl-D-alanine carboxypeptidase-like protein